METQVQDKEQVWSSKCVLLAGEDQRQADEAGQSGVGEAAQ